MSENKNDVMILVIEDNEDNVFIIKHYLERLGYSVTVAENGKIGVEKSKELKPDLILMDMMMPVMNGYEATNIIKSDDEVKEIPVIALTAHASIGDKEKAINAGCDDYLPKPIELQKLGNLVKKWMK